MKTHAISLQKQIISNSRNRIVFLVSFVLLLFPATTLHAQTDTVADSLKTLIESTREDTIRVNLLVELSTHFRRSSPDAAIQYGTEARDLARKLNFTKGEANALKYIGMAHYFQGQYAQTIQFWQEARETYASMDDDLGVANMLNNIGAIYFNTGDDNKAIEYYLPSLEVSEGIGDKHRIVTSLINIGAVYANKPTTYSSALEYYLRALPLSEEIGYQEAIGTTTVNIGELYLSMEEYDSALVYLEKSLIPLEQSGGNLPFALIQIGKVLIAKDKISQALEYLNNSYDLAFESNGKLEMSQALIGKGLAYAKARQPDIAIQSYLEAEKIAEEIDALHEFEDIYTGLSNLYDEKKHHDKAFKYQRLLTELHLAKYDTEKERTIDRLVLGYEIDQQKIEIDIQDLTIQKQRLVKNAFLIGLILIFIIAFIIYGNYRNKVKVNKILDKQNAEIESLILNILPEKVARELQREGSATPRYYKSVSVLFTDFKGFSKIAGSMSPQELVDELNEYFIAFDAITEKFNLEKIKTIGDSYMCAGGIPTEDDDNPINAVKAGLAMQEYINYRNLEKKNNGSVPWDLRVGIHTGPIVAGVVGRKKYAYDIWGDTVNVASRMESNGEAGKVNISASTYNLVKEKYACLHRGKITAKNIGDVDMYFILNTITEQLVLDAKEFVLNKFEDKLPDSCLFHTEFHTLDVLKATETIGNHSNLPEDDYNLLRICALFHDIGYIETHEKHEQISARYAREFLEKHNVSESRINQAINTILATEMPQSPKDLLGEILCDADLNHLTANDYFERMELMRLEWAKSGRSDFTEKQFHQNSIKFFEAHQYKSDYGKKVLQPLKEEVLHKIKQFVENLESNHNA